MARFLATSWLVLACPAIAADKLAVLPSNVTLTGPEARQQLLAERTHEGQFVGQMSSGVEFVSSDPDVVRIEKGVLVPVKNGATTISARAGKQTATVRVTVE